MRARMAGIAWVVGVGLCGTVQAADFHWEKVLAPGATVEIKNINGAVDARPASGDAVEVTATKQSRRSDPDSVAIVVEEHDGGVTVCAVYPSSRSRRGDCRSGDGGGGFETRDNDVEVHFVVRVPRGVALQARSVNGDVDIRDLDGDVEATTVNGSIGLETAGRATAETVNGSIVAAAGRSDWTGDAEFKTVNGSITVTLPSSTSADVEARSMNGEIETDFPLQVSGPRHRRNRMSGTIGGGGRRLELQTVNGSIELKAS